MHQKLYDRRDHRIAMKNIRIEIQSFKNAENPQKAVTIPLNKLDTGLQFLPKEIKAILHREGINIHNCKDLTKEKDLIGTLIEIENATERIVISAE